MAFGFLRRKDEEAAAEGKPAEAPAQEGAAVVRWCEENAKKGNGIARRFLELADAGWAVPSSDEEARE